MDSLKLMETCASILVYARPFYNEGMHVQMLIDRSVGNTNKGSRRWVNKLISFNAGDFEKNCIKLISQMYFLGNPNIRLYGTINARKYVASRQTFLHRLIDKHEDDLFWRDLNGSFVSACMQSDNASKSYFLIDCDSPEARGLAGAQIPKDKLVKHYSTPNGHHYITEGFDVRPLKGIPNVEIHRDGLMILHTMVEPKNG